MSYIKKPKDFYSGLFFALTGMGVIAVVQDYDLGTARQMGPAYFPMMLAIILVALSLLLTLSAMSGETERLSAVPMRPALLILGGTVLFGVLIRPAGLAIATFVMVFCGASASPELRPTHAFVVALALSIGSVVVFAYLLEQPLPTLGYWFG